VRSSAQWEIVPWVLSFGAHAQLIAPAEWRGSIMQNLVAMAKTYGGGEV
jgi:hypothetical protein